MIAYVDASVLLRLLLDQPNSLREWQQIERGASSGLIMIETLRTVDRLRLLNKLADRELARLRRAIFSLLASIQLIDVNAAVIDRAAQPMPTALGTLDAIHLATALLWQQTLGTAVVMATHSHALALAAEAHGMRVAGVSL